MQEKPWLSRPKRVPRQQQPNNAAAAERGSRRRAINQQQTTTTAAAAAASAGAQHVRVPRVQEVGPALGLPAETSPREDAEGQPAREQQEEEEEEGGSATEPLPTVQSRWNRLSTVERTAAKLLGFARDTWPAPAHLRVFGKVWSELSHEEVVAAEVLRYSAEIWDEAGSSASSESESDSDSGDEAENATDREQSDDGGGGEEQEARTQKVGAGMAAKGEQTAVAVPPAMSAFDRRLQRLQSHADFRVMEREGAATKLQARWRGRSARRLRALHSGAPPDDGAAADVDGEAEALSTLQLAQSAFVDRHALSTQQQEDLLAMLEQEGQHGEQQDGAVVCLVPPPADSLGRVGGSVARPGAGELPDGAAGDGCHPIEGSARGGGGGGGGGRGGRGGEWLVGGVHRVAMPKAMRARRVNRRQSHATARWRGRLRPNTRVRRSCKRSGGAMPPAVIAARWLSCRCGSLPATPARLLSDRIFRSSIVPTPNGFDAPMVTVLRGISEWLDIISHHRIAPGGHDLAGREACGQEEAAGGAHTKGEAATLCHPAPEQLPRPYATHFLLCALAHAHTRVRCSRSADAPWGPPLPPLPLLPPPDRVRSQRRLARHEQLLATAISHEEEHSTLADAIHQLHRTTVDEQLQKSEDQEAHRAGLAAAAVLMDACNAPWLTPHTRSRFKATRSRQRLQANRHSSDRRPQSAPGVSIGAGVRQLATGGGDATAQSENYPPGDGLDGFPSRLRSGASRRRQRRAPGARYSNTCAARATACITAIDTVTVDRHRWHPPTIN
jgi:hypothetical protein